MQALHFGCKSFRSRDKSFQEDEWGIGPQNRIIYLIIYLKPIQPTKKARAGFQHGLSVMINEIT
ncbi:hypothetical protein BWI96_02565 [Siphonobacter sp. SORGH_AS_0500]|nr:hypothetical protein BWI96_02565 [Siphonobacter sp. SORGH_AS_0500]